MISIPISYTSVRWTQPAEAELLRPAVAAVPIISVTALFSGGTPRRVQIHQPDRSVRLQ